MADKRLIEVITEALRVSGHPTPELWLSHPFIVTASQADCVMERIYVNRYWRQYLGALTIDTVMERYCLDDNAGDIQYIKNFNNVVIPTIINNLI